MISAIDLVARALPYRDPPQEPLHGLCCVLGREMPCIDRVHAIRDSFTNIDILRAPTSDKVSVEAWRVLTYTEQAPGKKRDRRPLMQSSWICDGSSITWLDRNAVRSLVLDGVAANRWAGYVTTSYKKHGVLRAPINNGTQRWLFETEVVDCTNRTMVLEWYDRLRTVRASGIPRPVIESLDIGLPLMRKHTALWMEFERWARPRHRSTLYRFLVHLLPSQEANSEINDGEK